MKRGGGTFFWREMCDFTVLLWSGTIQVLRDVDAWPDFTDGGVSWRPGVPQSYPSAIMDEVVFDGVSQKQAEHGPDAQAILEEIRQQSWMVRSLALPHHY